MTNLLFYVSGHGFGHAIRTAEVMRALEHEYTCFRILTRTLAPEGLFSGLHAVSNDVKRVEIDSGVVETEGTLRIDKDATVAQLANFLERCDDIVAMEAEFVRQNAISLIVADIPYLAGEIAERADVPSMAIGNFTWDWIYEPCLEGHDSGDAFLARIRRGYASMACYLRLPFSHDTESFSRVVDVPLITRRSQRDREHILTKLGVREDRSRVVYAMRSPTSLEALRRAAKKDPNRLYFYFGRHQPDMPENTQSVVLDDQLSFPDMLSICDAVVSKLGYGILADCISSQTAVLFPPRVGFREDDMLVPAAFEYLRARELPLDNYESGDWLTDLQQLEAVPKPSGCLGTNGAVICAQLLAEEAKQA